MVWKNMIMRMAPVNVERGILLRRLMDPYYMQKIERRD